MTKRPASPSHTASDDPTFGRLMYHKGLGVLSVVGLVVSALLPVGGFSVGVCWFFEWTTLPCPGCGMTRSVTALSHLDWWTALQFNVFGYAAWSFMIVNSILAFSPARWTAWFRRFLRRHRWRTDQVMTGLLGGLLLFGTARLVYYAATDATWPPSQEAEEPIDAEVPSSQSRTSRPAQDLERAAGTAR